MKSLSEIETTSKRAARAAGFSWGISEEVGKCVRLLELFGLPGIVNLNSYLKEKNINDFENLKLNDWNQAIDVNLTGVFLCCQNIGKQMLKQKSGNMYKTVEKGGYSPRYSDNADIEEKFCIPANIW